MSELARDVEKIVRNVSAIMSYENMDLTEQNKCDMCRILRGEATGDEIIAEIEKRHNLTKGALKQ